MLLEAHKPIGMTTWYGKTFKHDSQGIGNYWKPVHDLLDLVRGVDWPLSATFKYYGTVGQYHPIKLGTRKLVSKMIIRGINGRRTGMITQ